MQSAAPRSRPAPPAGRRRPAPGPGSADRRACRRDQPPSKCSGPSGLPCSDPLQARGRSAVRPAGAAARRPGDQPAPPRPGPAARPRRAAGRRRRRTARSRSAAAPSDARRSRAARRGRAPARGRRSPPSRVTRSRTSSPSRPSHSSARTVTVDRLQVDRLAPGAPGRRPCRRRPSWPSAPAAPARTCPRNASSAASIACVVRAASPTVAPIGAPSASSVSVQKPRRMVAS